MHYITQDSIPLATLVEVVDTPPAVTVSYSGGTYTLTVSDNESGVWKITNRDGTVVYRDYSC